MKRKSFVLIDQLQKWNPCKASVWTEKLESVLCIANYHCHFSSFWSYTWKVSSYYSALGEARIMGTRNCNNTLGAFCELRWFTVFFFLGKIKKRRDFRHDFWLQCKGRESSKAFMLHSLPDHSYCFLISIKEELPMAIQHYK